MRAAAAFAIARAGYHDQHTAPVEVAQASTLKLELCPHARLHFLRKCLQLASQIVIFSNVQNEKARTMAQERDETILKLTSRKLSVSKARVSARYKSTPMLMSQAKRTYHE